MTKHRLTKCGNPAGSGPNDSTTLSPYAVISCEWRISQRSQLSPFRCRDPRYCRSWLSHISTASGANGIRNWRADRRLCHLTDVETLCEALTGCIHSYEGRMFGTLTWSTWKSLGLPRQWRITTGLRLSIDLSC